MYSGPLFSLHRDIREKKNNIFSSISFRDCSVVAGYCGVAIVVVVAAVIFIVQHNIFIAHFYDDASVDAVMTLFSVQSCLLDDDYDDELNIFNLQSPLQ